MLNQDLKLSDQTQYSDLLTGMSATDCVTLQPGTQLYRFASSTRRDRKNGREMPLSLSEQLASPWWWQEADFRFFARHMELDRMNPGMVARTVGAIKMGWGSRVDVVLTAVLAESARAFTGPGRPQFDGTPDPLTGARFHWVPPVGANQTYIPGLKDRATHGMSREGRRALSMIQKTTITSLTFGQEWGLGADSLKGKIVTIPYSTTVH